MRLLALLALLTGLVTAEEIPAGTRLLLRAEQTVRSRSAKAGDRVRFRTVFPAVEGERVVVPAGTFVDAEVGSVERSRWVGGHAKMTLQAIRMVLPNGRVYPLSPLAFAPFPSSATRPPKKRPYLSVAGVLASIYTIGAASYGTTGQRATIAAIDAGLLARLWAVGGRKSKYGKGWSCPRSWISRCRWTNAMKWFSVALVLLPGLLLADEIPAGTRVLLRIQQSITSKTAKVGDRVRFETVEQVMDHGRAVLPAGSSLEAVVEKVKRSGRVRGRAELNLRAERVMANDGRNKSIAGGTFESIPFSHPRRLVGGRVLAYASIVVAQAALLPLAEGKRPNVAFTSGVGGVLLGAALLPRGGEIEIRRGGTLEIFFDQPVPLD